jgi:hypothetical protein
MLILFFVLGICSSALADNKEWCQVRVAKSKIPKAQQEKFCECWVANLNDLNPEEAAIVERWATLKMQNRDFEKADMPLSSFVYQIEEECLGDPSFRVQKPKAD